MQQFFAKSFERLRLKRGRHLVRILNVPGVGWRLLRSPMIDNKVLSVSLCRATWRRGSTPLFLAIGAGNVCVDCLQCNHTVTRDWVGIRETPLYGFARNHLFGSDCKEPYESYLSTVHDYSRSTISERISKFESLIDWVRSGGEASPTLAHIAPDGSIQIKDGAHRACAALALEPAAQVRCNIVV